MKTGLLLLLIVALGWLAQLKLHNIPALETQIELAEIKKDEATEQLSLLKLQKAELAEQVEKFAEANTLLTVEIEALKKERDKPAPVLVETVKEPEPEVKEDYSAHNSAIMSKIALLTNEKRQEKTALDNRIAEIDGFIAKGKGILEQHMKVQPNFKEGSIRTSEADRVKWQEQHKARENFLRTEISKLEGQKENLIRAYNTLAAKLDLEIQKLEREIK